MTYLTDETLMDDVDPPIDSKPIASKMHMLYASKRIYYDIMSSNLEDLIKDVYDIDISFTRLYEIEGGETIEVCGISKEDDGTYRDGVDLYCSRKIDEFIKGGYEYCAYDNKRRSRLTYSFFVDLCRKGLIEPGHYLMDVQDDREKWAKDEEGNWYERDDV